MSAFLVGTDHIDFLISAAIDYRLSVRMPEGWTTANRTNADAIGMMLLAENAASVSDRYAHRDDLSADERGETAAFYRFKYASGVGSTLGMMPVDVLNAIACYRYQASEHDAWKDSAAADFCDRLQSEAIGHLPGHSDAQWEWTRTKQAERTKRERAAAAQRIAARRTA